MTDIRKKERAVVYIHGKGGSAAEAAHYESLFPESDVIGFDYRAETPWEAQKEFKDYFDGIKRAYSSFILIANSIGAFFALCALPDVGAEKAYFISPVTDMEKLITDSMAFQGVTEDELREKKEIPSGLGEPLSWDYLCYVRAHKPTGWNIPTRIIYGENDGLVPFETVKAFAESIGGSLTVMPGGEHWFHTPEQMRFLDRWIKES